MDRRRADTKHGSRNATQPGSEERRSRVPGPRSPALDTCFSSTLIRQGATTMSLVTWNDVYCDLWMQAAKSRGTVTSAGSVRGASWPTTLPEWPRTTDADVLAIAAVVDPILIAT